MDGERLKQHVNNLFRTGQYDGIKALLLSNKDTTEHDNDLATLCYLCTVYEQEKTAGQRTIFEKTGSIDALLKRYTALKFYLRRIDFDIMDDMNLFYQFLSEEQITSYELLRVLDFSVVHREKVLRQIAAGGMTDDWLRVHQTDGMATADIGQMCFIICSNNPIYAQECIYYIRHLAVPEGMEITILTVEDAASLTSAYNEAMCSSQAKYKVYLHHDTFIVNPYFISDCLAVFAQDERIGMLGNIGVVSMPASGVMWDGNRYGMLYEQHIYETELLARPVNSEAKYMQVEAIDGFLMVTQYDIPWREDLFTGWDFYDCSQSMEFIRNGYKVVVPQMKQPWCVHDCGFLNLKNYEEEREKFIREYLSERNRP